jgi:DNA-binding GntR family transcriptional regulator
MNTALPLSSNNRLSEQLRDLIEERIATGFYLPGVRLDESELASEFGVSRTPVREALFQLEMSGLVEIRPRRGAIVKNLTPQQLYEMFEVMAELESMCARLASRRMSEPEVTGLRKAHEACEAAKKNGDPDQYYHLNKVFHESIYKGSHNSFLTEQAMNLHRRLAPYRRLQLRVRGRMDKSLDEHELIVKAIEQADENAAADVVRSHVVVQGDRFADLVSMMNNFDGPHMDNTATGL